MKTPKFLFFAIAGMLLCTLSAQADITTGLVGYWAFDDGAPSSTTADSSGNGNTGTLTGFSDGTFTSMWTTNAYHGDALIFNQGSDTGNYVSVPDSSTLDVGVNGSTPKAFTIAAWVNSSAAASTQGAIVAKGTGGGQENYVLDIASSKFRVFTRTSASGNASVTCSSTVGPTVGVWTHVVGTFVASNSPTPGRLVIYINGVSNNTTATTFPGMENTSHVVSIGNRQSSTTTYNLPWYGTLDDVRIYNRALTPGDVAQLFENYGAAPTITTPPRSVSCYVGDSPAFLVAAQYLVPGIITNSTTPFTYQWQLNGTNIPGATATTLQLSNVQATNAGTYTVFVGDALATNSASATLTVNPLPAANTTSGLVGWWKFQDGSGSSTAADSSGNNNPGALSDFADGSFTSMWTGGLLGGALAFNKDGSLQDVVAIPAIGTPAPAVLDFSLNGVYTNGSFTLAAWIRGNLTQKNGSGLIAHGTGNGGEQYVMDIENIPGAAAPIPGYFRFYVRDTNGVATQTAPTTLGPNGNWQHVVGVMNVTNGIMNLYVNGVLESVGIAPFSLQPSSTEVSLGNRQAGSSGYGDAFIGLMDDVRIYNRDLTSADVHALYEQGAPYPAFTSSTPPASMPPVTYTNLYTVYPGAPSTVYSVTVSGTPTPSLQWYFNGVGSSGQTNASFTNATPVAGSWTVACVASSSLGTATNLWSLDVIATNSPSFPPYPLAVLGNNPVGYWRLDEPDGGLANGNFGAVVHDFVGGHNGVYTNANLGLIPDYNTTTDPNGTAAQFGAFATANSFAGKIPGISFATNANGNFSLECWIHPTTTTPGSAADILTTGEYGVDDQFSLSFNSASPYDYRFYVRNAAGNVINVVSTQPPVVGWQHIVAVCNQTAGYSAIYINGVSNNSVANPSTGGLYTPANPAVFIGSGTDNKTSYDKQTACQMSDVAIYNYALTAAEVSAHYNANGAGPAFAMPYYTNLDYGATLVVAPMVTAGTPPLTYSWYDDNANTVVSTSPILTIPDMTNSDSYTLTVANAFPPYSAAQSISVNVISDLTLNADIYPLSDAVYVGTPITYTFSVNGALPLAYQWYNGAAPILNATNATYTVIAGLGTNNYSCTVTNNSATPSLTSSTATLTGVVRPTDLYSLTVLSNNPVAYWRLDETEQGSGDDGVIAYDYVGGHDATYNNVILDVPGYNAFDPDTAAQFGVFASPNSYASEIDNSGNGIPLIDFSVLAAGGTAEFSVEAWVNTTNSEPANGGIVSKGYNGGGEQFVLEADGAGAEFYLRDGVGSLYTAGPAGTINDGHWHHLVGVCDQGGSVATLYVDGVNVADAYGLQAGKNVKDPSSGNPLDYAVDIGARSASSSASSLADQFKGTIDEVALYPEALTAAQVSAHYNAGIYTPIFTLSITNLGNGSVQINWPQGTLQGATNVNGPYTSITNAVSPYVVPATNAQQFYRVEE